MSGPRIAVVGEAWGEDEAVYKMPFVGATGNLLNDLLEEAGIDRQDCFLTNVFNLRPGPTSNDIKQICVPKKESTVRMPQLSSNAYLADQYWPEVERLYRELAQLQPNLIIALGNTAAWALLQTSGIKAVRGTVTHATAEPIRGLKVLPTYHPAAIFRETKLRPIVVADLCKAERQSHFPEVRRPKREVWIEPKLSHMELFYENYLVPARRIAFDIETAGNQITCIGFAPNERRALVVPFVDNRQNDGSYWRDPADEVRAWEFVRNVLRLRARKLGQNTLYDIHWLWRLVGLTPVNYGEDTMLLHHALHPESDKGLGFLGSLYTDEPAWKTMRGKGLFTMKKEN